MEILPGIHHFNTDPFNWYVIEEDGRLTLVDAGFSGHYPIFRKGLRSIGRELKDVEAVILTHAHADHVGFAERVRRETNAPVFVHRNDCAAARRPLQLPWWGLLSNAWRPFMAGTLTRAAYRGVFSLTGVVQVHPFEDGAILDIPGRPRVMHAPGHTPGEVVFHLPAHNVLFSGDVLITRHLLTGAHGPPQVPHRALNSDDSQARRTLDRLRELGRVTLLPGHGRPWSGSMVEAVELARKISS